MQDFWEDLAKGGTWASHYKGETGLNTYNFYTRRDAVEKLLKNEGRFARVLDIGCGSGDYLQVATAHEGAYFGLDYAYSMIEEARRQINGRADEHLLLVGEGQQLPYQDKSFDLVMAMGYIEYFEDPTLPTREIRRVLKPGGTLVIQSFKRDMFSYLDQYGVNPLRNIFGRSNGFEFPSNWVDKKYSQRQLDRLLKDFGFVRKDFVFNNFHVLPGILRSRYPGRYIRISEAISELNPSLWRFLAVNYIAKYKLLH